MLKPKRTRQNERGQALVEFAIILPLLMIFLLGIFQFGFLFSTHIGLINAVREGARYGATVPTIDGSTATAVENAVWDFGANSGKLGQATGFSEASLVSRSVTYCKYSVTVSGGTPPVQWHVRERVQVVYDHPLNIPIVGALIDGIDSPSTPNAFRVTITEEMRVENAFNISEPTALAACS